MRRKAIAAVALSAVLLLGGGVRVSQTSAGQVELTCNGLAPTIESNDAEVFGTGGADVIVAFEAKFVYGLGGNDSICTIESGLVYAGAGNDYVAAPDGQGGTCPFAIYGGSGADNLTCANEIYGESSNDHLALGGLLSGGSGNDFLDFGTASCDGGSGSDTAIDCLGEVKSIEHLL